MVVGVSATRCVVLLRVRHGGESSGRGAHTIPQDGQAYMLAWDAVCRTVNGAGIPVAYCRRCRLSSAGIVEGLYADGL